MTPSNDLHAYSLEKTLNRFSFSVPRFQPCSRAGRDDASGAQSSSVRWFETGVIEFALAHRFEIVECFASVLFSIQFLVIL